MNFIFLELNLPAEHRIYIENHLLIECLFSSRPMSRFDPSAVVTTKYINYQSSQNLLIYYICLLL